MVRPSLKTSIPWISDGTDIHFRLSGELTTVEDPDGRVGCLLKLLDGRHDAAEIHAELRDRFPDVTLDEVRQAIGELDAEGLLQDVTDTGADFSASERQRWANNFGFFESYASLAMSKFEFQRRLRDAKVALLGVGGVGSHALLDLVAIGFTDIRIVDFDRIDLSNLNRQVLYGDRFVGRPKIEVAAARAKELNNQVRIDALDARLASVDDVARVVADRDVVLAVADTPKLSILHWVNEACLAAGVPFVSGGVENRRSLEYVVAPGVSGCLECWYESVRTVDPTSRMLMDSMRAQQERGEAFGEDTSAFDGLVLFTTALMVADAVRLATRMSTPLGLGRVLELSFDDPRVRVAESWGRLPDCFACADVEPPPGLRWLPDAPPPAF